MLLNYEKHFDIVTKLFFHLNAWNLPIFKCAKIRYHSPPTPMLLELGMDCILLITIFNLPKIGFLAWHIVEFNIFWKILCLYRKNRKCYSISQYLNKDNCKFYSFMNKNVNVSESRQFLFQNSFNMKSEAIKIYFKNIFAAM